MFWRWKSFLQRLLKITVEELQGKHLNKKKGKKNEVSKKAFKKGQP